MSTLKAVPAGNITHSSIFAMLRDGNWTALAEQLEAAREAGRLAPSEKIHLGIALANLGRIDEIGEVVSTDQLRNEENRNLFRRLAVTTAMRDGRLEHAASLARMLLVARPDDSRDLELLGKILIRTGDRAEGDALLETAGEKAPNDLNLAARRIFTRLREGRVRDAAELANRYIDKVRQSARLGQVCLIALERAGEAGTAAPVVDALAEVGMMDGATAFAGASVYLAVNRPKDALLLCQKALADGEETGRLNLGAAQALIALHAPVAEILAHLELAREASEAGEPGVLAMVGGVLMQIGRFEEAAKVLKQSLDAQPRALKTRLSYARALKSLGRYEEAADVFVDAPDSKTASWARHKTAALLQAGRHDEAADYYGQVLRKRGAKLAASLHDHLDEIADVSSIPQVRLDWAWDLVTRLSGGQPSTDRAEWDRRAHWGAQADIAILDWLECRPQNMDEIVEMMDWDVPGIHLIGELAAAGRGCLIASAHVGPLYTGPVFLAAAKVPFKVIASTPRVSSAGYVGNLISTIDQSELAVARQVMTAVKGGDAVIIAIDGSVDPAAKRVNWEGTPITCSKFIAELVYRGVAPSVFAQPYWQGNRIGVHVNRMPEPEAGEAEDAFVTRWLEAFYDELRAFVQRGPENLRLAGGIWRNISNTDEQEA